MRASHRQRERTRTRHHTRADAQAPSLVMVLAFIALAFLLIPLAGLLRETPWSELPELLASPTAVEALRLSLVTSILAAAVATVLGVPLAWVLARREFRGQRLVRGADRPARAVWGSNRVSCRNPCKYCNE